MAEFTVSITRDYTYREGYGVNVMPFWSEDERIESIEVEVVRIAKDGYVIMGGAACVATDEGFIPIDCFQDVPDLVEDDTHDLRCRFFETREDADAHAEYTRKRFDSPSPWESFVKLS